MINILVISVVLAVCLAAAFYIRKAKRSGQKCIGCPGSCTGVDGKSTCAECGYCSGE